MGQACGSGGSQVVGDLTKSHERECGRGEYEGKRGTDSDENLLSGAEASKTASQPVDIFVIAERAVADFAALVAGSGGSGRQVYCQILDTAHAACYH